jgi:hypothetical protein
LAWISKNQNKIITLFLILTSIFSLILTLYLINYSNNHEEKISFHNIIIGSTFVSLCFIGSIASIFPNSCGKIFSSKGKKNQNTIHSLKKSNSQGHHHQCKKYSNHTLKIRDKYLCATCTGLLTGAILGIVGSIMYFYAYLQVEIIPILTILGAVGILFGFFQSIIPKTKGPLSRFFAGILLVLGTFILLVNLDQVMNNTLIDFFFIATSIFWIFTKVNLSQREHKITCLNCSIKHC